MLSYKESLKILKETKALLDGHFILSSGLHSNQYVQCAKLLSNPSQAKIICTSLVEKILSTFKDINTVLSPALGGMIAGYEVARQLNVKNIFAERVDGELSLRRGFEINKDSKILIMEDVITTGKSALECYNLVKKYNGDFIGFSCIIDRSNTSLLIKDKIISQIKLDIETFKENELPDYLKEIPSSSPGSRNIS
jgi:orotate phosphoribosyltransferase